MLSEGHQDGRWGSGQATGEKEVTGDVELWSG